MHLDPLYSRYREAIQGKPLPLAYVDLDAFDANIEYAARLAKKWGKTIRVGTKSIRCEPLLQRIFQLGGQTYRGCLTFTVEETAWLAAKGYDDFIIAYPSVQRTDLELWVQLARQGKRVSMMVDDLEQASRYAQAAQAARVTLDLCLEIDLAYRPLGLPSLHLGLRRSPIRTVKQARELWEAIRTLPNLHLNALMGYEGHIAGVGDALPGKPLKNALTRLLKGLARRDLRRRRQAIVAALREAGAQLEVVNGGGSGSLVSTLSDPSVSEVTVGSGFYCSALFQHFREVHYQPAAFFALQVVRRPAPGMVTCQGGGYVASGASGADKLPRPVLPEGLQLTSLEGAGEVQTPLRLPVNCVPLSLGDPVIFQHAKAGELCERFNELYLIQGYQIVGCVPTYRGEGKAFL
ncbi:MAG: L-gulono-1,4-lactone oxidase [Anaerolineae bacterium]|jgi:D-serine deaminase-like pyridoxal phosphate-dependent protein|nr:MAG: L-gulono-1,4-lactone oxidase [Anaerolineae bacterium]